MNFNSFSNDNDDFKAFQDDISYMWSKKLVSEFSIQNNIIWKRLYQDLETPIFAFSMEKTKWGSWDSGTKTLTLSYHLLRNYEWDAVIHTLKHEMAHMIVTELWSDIEDNTSGHGELFKKACAIMGIDAEKKHSSIEKAEYQIPENEKILSKIHKLFCLGESNHKEEANAAIAKAHELMIKYNISNLDLPKERKLFVFRPVGRIYDRIPEYIKSLARIVCDNYFVKHIYIAHRDSRFKVRRTIEFFGERHNMDVSEYIFHFLLQEGERQWKDFQNTEEYQNRYDEGDYRYSFNRKTGEDCKRKKGKFSKIAFLEGVYSGFARTLEAKNIEVVKVINAQRNMPITLDDPLLEEKFKSHYRPKNWNCGGRGSNGGGFSEGVERGSKITIRSGVSRGNGAGRLALNA